MFEGNPLIIGPLLLTQRQRQSDYSQLWSVLLSSARHVEFDQLIFVTDGEEALLKSLQNSFPNCLLFRCTAHLKDNIRRKLVELGVCAQLVKSIIADIEAQFQLRREEFTPDATQKMEKWTNMAGNFGCEQAVQRFLMYYQKNIKSQII